MYRLDEIPPKMQRGVGRKESVFYYEYSIPKSIS